jgi:hypothetical protein
MGPRCWPRILVPGFPSGHENPLASPAIGPFWKSLQVTGQPSEDLIVTKHSCPPNDVSGGVSLSLWLSLIQVTGSFQELGLPLSSGPSFCHCTWNYLSRSIFVQEFSKLEGGHWQEVPGINVHIIASASIRPWPVSSVVSGLVGHTSDGVPSTAGKPSCPRTCFSSTTLSVMTRKGHASGFHTTRIPWPNFLLFPVVHSADLLSSKDIIVLGLHSQYDPCKNYGKLFSRMNFIIRVQWLKFSWFVQLIYCPPKTCLSMAYIAQYYLRRGHRKGSLRMIFIIRFLWLNFPWFVHLIYCPPKTYLSLAYIA